MINFIKELKKEGICPINRSKDNLDMHNETTEITKQTVFGKV